MLASVLGKNKSLTSLSLSIILLLSLVDASDIGSEGAGSLARLLDHNQTLTSLELCMHTIYSIIRV